LEYAGRLNLGGTKEHWDELVRQAAEDKISYADFCFKLLKSEIDRGASATLKDVLRLPDCP